MLSTSGNTLVQSLSLDGAEKANGGKLVFHVQDGPDVDLSDGGDGAGPTVQELVGSIEKAEVEQEGPVRAVVKVRIYSISCLPLPHLRVPLPHLRVSLSHLRIPLPHLRVPLPHLHVLLLHSHVPRIRLSLNHNPVP